MAEGRYTLLAELDLKQFNSAFSTFERGLKADLSSLERQFSQVFSGAAAKGLSGAYTPLTNELKAVQAEARRTGDGLGSIGTGAARAKGAADPLRDAINSLKNETASYRNIVEATDVSNADAIKNFDRLKTSALNMADGLEEGSKQHRDLTQTAAQAARSVKTLEGEVSKLGLSQQVAIGTSQTLGDRTKTLGTDFIGLGGTIGGLVGVAGFGGLLTAGVGAVSGVEVATGRLQAQLGLTADEANVLQGVAVDVFKNNFGGSVGEVTEKISILNQTMGDLTDEQSQRYGEMALTIEDVYGADFQETVNTANTLVRQFGLTNEEAFDFITTGFQKGLNSSGDFLESVNEYSTQFSNGGASADQFFSLLESGMQGGALGTDKAADAFKEFRLRIQDGSKTTADALAQIGISADDLGKKMSSGQISAADAFELVTNKISATEDPLIRMQAGAGLLGTQFEDLGDSGVAAISLTGTALDDMAGATDRAADAAYSNLSGSLSTLRRSLTTTATEGFEPVAAGLSTVIDGFLGLPTPVQESATLLAGIGTAGTAGALGLGAIVTIAPQVIAGFRAIQASSALLFAPPAGLIIAGAVAATALGTAIYQMATKHETAAEKMERLETAAADLTVPLDALKDVTSKEQLGGAVDALAETMDGEARTAFENYAESALESAKTTGDAVLSLYAYILDYRKKLKEDTLEEARKVLEQATEQADKVRNDPAMFSGDGQAQLVVDDLAAKLIAGRQALEEQQGLLNKALEEGNAASARKYEENVATLKSSISRVQGELAEAVKNLPASQINFAVDGENEAIRTVRELEAELGEIISLLAGGTRADFEAYFGSIETGATGAGDALAGVSKEAKTAFAGVKTQFDSLGDLDATGADNLITSLQGLKDTYPELKAALNPLIVSTQDHIVGLEGTVPAAVSATDSLVNLREEQKLLNEEFEKAPEGSQRAKDLAVEIRGIDARIEAQENLLESVKEVSDADVAAAVGATKAGDAAENQAGRVKLLDSTYADVVDSVDTAIKTYAQVGDEVKLLDSTYATVTDAVDISNTVLADVAKPVGIAITSYSEVTDAVELLTETYAEVPDEVATPIPDTSATLDYLAVLQNELPGAYTAALAENDLFNTGLSDAAVKAGVAREKLQELINQGLNPQSEAVRLAAAEWNKYQDEVESAALANEVLNAALSVVIDGLGELGDGFAESLGGDDAAKVEALKDQFSALKGMLESLITLDVGGFVSNLVTGVVDGFTYLWNEITGKNAADEAEANTEVWRGVTEKLGEVAAEAAQELADLREEFSDLMADINEAGDESASSVLESRLDFAVDSGQINEQYAGIKEAKLGIIDAYADYQDTLAGLQTQQTNLDSLFASGAITQQEYNTALAEINTQRGNAYTQLGLTTGSYIEDAKGLAAELGLSEQELYEALLTGNDAVLGQIGPEATAALQASLGAYVAEFGALPPEMQRVADELGLSYDPITQSFVAGGQQVVGGINAGGELQRQALSTWTSQLLADLGPAAQPIIDQINALYASQASAHTEGGTLTGQAAQAGLGATSIQTFTSQLLTQFGPAAQSIVDQINGLYSAQAGAHTGGGTTVGTALGGASTQLLGEQAFAASQQYAALETDRFNLTSAIAGFYGDQGAFTTQGGANAATAIWDAYTAQSGTLYSAVDGQHADLSWGQRQLVGDIFNLYDAQSGQFVNGATGLNESIAGVADAQNTTQKDATKTIADYLATTQGGLLKDIAGHATDEANLFSLGGVNVQKAYATTQNDKAKLLQTGVTRYVGLLGNAADSIYSAAKAVFDADAAGLTGQGKPAKQAFGGFRKPLSEWRDIIAGIAKRGSYETLPGNAMGSYKPPDPNETKVAKPKKGSIAYADEQLDKLEEQYANETDPAKRRKLAQKIKQLRKARENMDYLVDRGTRPDSDKPSKGGAGGSGKDVGPKGSPSYIQDQIRQLDEAISKATSSGKIRELQGKKKKLQEQLDKLLGSDGKTPGSTKGTDVGPKGSPSYLQNEIRKFNDLIDDATSPKRIKELQGKRAKLQAELDKLLGVSQDPQAGKGSVDYLQEQIQKEQAKYDAATTDAARSASAERLRLLKDELEQKQALLKDAEKEAGKGSNVITIESPIANLDGILSQVQDAKTFLQKDLERVQASVSTQLTSSFARAADVGSVSSTFAASAAPTLPAYQAQLDGAGTKAFAGHVSEFGVHVREFGQHVRELRTGRGSTTTLVDKAKGNGIFPFNFTR